MMDFNLANFDLNLLSDYIYNFYSWLKLSNVGRLLIATLIMLFAVVIKDLFSFLIVKLLNFLVLKKITYGQEQSLREIGQPIEFIPIVVGVYLSLNVIKVPASFLFYTRNLLKSLYIFNITWLIYSLVNPFVMMFKKTHLDNTNTVIITWVVRISKFVIFIIGFSSILESWGVKVSTLIASLGIVGMAVALGAQDMFKNIISGIAIISEKRFNVGDIIEFKSGDYKLEGIVENIGFRSTIIRQFDKTYLYVPNNTLADAAIVNVSSRKYRRINCTISLEYRTTANQLRYIRQEIENYLMDNPNVIKPPEGSLQVRVDMLSPYSIDLLVYCFVNSNVWADWLKVKESLLFKIREIVEEAGAAWALPSSSLYVEKVDKDLHLTTLPNQFIDKIKVDNEKMDKNLYLFQNGDV